MGPSRTIGTPYVRDTCRNTSGQSVIGGPRPRPARSQPRDLKAARPDTDPGSVGIRTDADVIHLAGGESAHRPKAMVIAVVRNTPAHQATQSRAAFAIASSTGCRWNWGAVDHLQHLDVAVWKSNAS